MKMINWILFLIGGFLTYNYLQSSISLTPDQMRVLSGSLMQQMKTEPNPEVRQMLAQIYDSIPQKPSPVQMQLPYPGMQGVYW